MDQRLRIVIALSILSLLLLTAAWILSNKIALIQPATAHTTVPLISEN